MWGMGRNKKNVAPVNHPYRKIGNEREIKSPDIKSANKIGLFV